MRHRLSCHTWGIEDHTHIKHAETEQIRITLWDVDVETEYLYRDPREGQPDQTFPMEELPDISYLSYLSRGRPSLSANAAALHDGGTDDVDIEAEDISRDPREGQPDQTAVEEEPPDISDVVRGRHSLSANAAALHDGDTDDVDLKAEDISRDPREGQPDQTAVEEEPLDISVVVRGRPSLSANAAALHDGDTDDVDREAEDISRDPREGQPDQTVVEEEPPDISDVVRGRPSVSANANAAASHDDDGDTAEARNRRARALMMKEWIVNVNQRLVNIESTVQRIEAMITEQIAETVEAETRAAPWPPAPPRRPRSRSVHRIMRS